MAMTSDIPMQNGIENVSLKDEINANGDFVVENVAMHLFTTMQVEKLLDEGFELPYLVQAFEACGLDVAMFCKEEIMTTLLDQCFNRIQTQVFGFLKNGLVPVTLSLLPAASREGDKLVTYMVTLASSNKYPMVLESVQIPSIGDPNAIHDLTRIVENLSCPVAGCVVPCSTTESRQTCEMLQSQFPAMYFHGCMRDALQSLVRQLFGATEDVKAESKHTIPISFTQDLQQFALQCNDLIFFLPRSKKLDLDWTTSETNTTVHVTARRRLRVKEAFGAVLQAEAFLDVEHVFARLVSSVGGTSSPHDGAHYQTQLLKIVRSPQFVEKLRKYLALFQPIHTLLSSISEPSTTATLLVSEVYSSLSKLTHQFDSIGLFSPEDKISLQALTQQLKDKVLGSAHLLAYLLDPVLLAEDLPTDTKTEVEQKLMDSLRKDDTGLVENEKKALHTQYMDFKKFAWNQKTTKADTLAFRALKERKKLPLQFWFAEGSKWPVLQAIACRVFVMPVCAANPARLILESGLASSTRHNKTDQSSFDKLSFIRVNSRQLQLAEAEGSSLAALVKKAPSEGNADDITASMVV